MCHNIFIIYNVCKPGSILLHWHRKYNSKIQLIMVHWFIISISDWIYLY